MSEDNSVEGRSETNPPSWRLINLALGLSSVIYSLIVAIGSTSQSPSIWIDGKWFLPDIWALLLPDTQLILRLAVNLWLPASVLMLLFYRLLSHL